MDSSHGTGKSAFVGPMARAAVAVGADGLMVEIHADPFEFHEQLLEPPHVRHP